MKTPKVPKADDEEPKWWTDSMCSEFCAFGVFFITHLICMATYSNKMVNKKRRKRLAHFAELRGRIKGLKHISEKQ
jgi:hypothetical protein